MPSILLPLTLCCLVLGACGKSSPRSSKPTAPAEPVATATTDAPESSPSKAAPAEAASVEPMATEPTAKSDPTPVAPVEPTPPVIEPKPTPVVQAKAPVAEPSKSTRSRRDAALASAPAVEPHAPVPELPALVNPTTTPEQLAAHALVVAREEVAAGAANGYSVLDRQAHLLATWVPAMQARQAELAAIAQARETRSQKQVSEAERLSTNEARLRKMEAEYGHKAAAEQAKTAPILAQ